MSILLHFMFNFFSNFHFSKVDENSAKNLELAQQDLDKQRSELEAATQNISTLQGELEHTKQQLSDRAAELTSREQTITQLQSQLSNTEAALAEKSQVCILRCSIDRALSNLWVISQTGSIQCRHLVT